MKTSLIIIMLALFAIGAPARSNNEGFVVANGMTYICQAMKTGMAYTRIISADGSIVKVPNYSVQAYRINGHQYELLPLVDRMGDTIDKAFMEFICMRDGSRLYRYCSTCNKYDPLSGEIAPLNRVYRYYLLTEGRLELLTDEGCKKMLASFDVKVIFDKQRN